MKDPVSKEFKPLLLQECKKLLDEKLKALKAALQEVTEAANNETKSSAGDKHETSRAMMQIEQEKIGKQIKEAEHQRELIEKIGPDNRTEQIALGSLVETDQGLFFIAVGLGKICLQGKAVLTISAMSPLALAFMRCRSDSFSFNGRDYKIVAFW